MNSKSGGVRVQKRHNSEKCPTSLFPLAIVCGFSANIVLDQLYERLQHMFIVQYHYGHRPDRQVWYTLGMLYTVDYSFIQ